jgi:glycosyltransferase involved in cell wall biosynthesis
VLSHSRIYDDNIVGIMCGEGIDTNNSHIVEMCRQNNLTINQDVYLLGFRTDVNKLMSSCDVFVLHSASEAFPNTLLQAMACESLCVTTNVGDAKKIIANEKLVVEPHDYLALSNKILEILHLPEDLKFIEKKKNVNKIIENYDIHHVLKEYELLLIDELNVR